jgi:hypothetical protein
VDAAVSHRPDSALLAVAGQEDGAGFDAVGISDALVRCGGVMDVDLAHRFLPRT